MDWTPKSKAGIGASNANAELSAAYQPPAGTFSWTGGYPPNLKDQWKSGSGNMLDVGAVRAFESVTGLTMDGDAGHTVWSDLLSAAAEGKHNPNGYTYALTDQAVPETIKIWHNGRLVLESAVNTGTWPGRRLSRNEVAGQSGRATPPVSPVPCRSSERPGGPLPAPAAKGWIAAVMEQFWQRRYLAGGPGVPGAAPDQHGRRVQPACQLQKLGGRSWVRTSAPSLVRRNRLGSRPSPRDQFMRLDCENDAWECPRVPGKVCTIAVIGAGLPP